MKSAIMLLGGLVIFLFLCIYWRTGYFESSIQTNDTTIYFKGGDSIVSQRYYRDLSGNWILLDKNIIVPESKWSGMKIKN